MFTNNNVLGFEDLYGRSQSDPQSPWYGATKEQVAAAVAPFDQGASTYLDIQSSPIKKASYWYAGKVNDLAEFTGLSDVGSKFGGWFGDLIGSENTDQFREQGRAMAGDILSMAPLFAAAPIAGMLGGAAAGTAGAVGLGAGVTSMAANALGKTGSYGDAAITAAMLPIMGIAGGVGGRAATKLLGTELGSVGDALMYMSGSQLGQAAAGIGVGAAETLHAGGGVDDILNKDFIGMNVMGVLPFVGLDLVRMPKTLRERRATAVSRREAAKAKDALVDVVNESTLDNTTPRIQGDAIDPKGIPIDPIRFDADIQEPSIAKVSAAWDAKHPKDVAADLHTPEHRVAVEALKKQGVNEQAARLFVKDRMNTGNEYGNVAVDGGAKISKSITDAWAEVRSKPVVPGELAFDAIVKDLDPKTARVLKARWTKREHAYDYATAEKAAPSLWAKKRDEYLAATAEKLKNSGKPKTPKDVVDAATAAKTAADMLSAKDKPKVPPADPNVEGFKDPAEALKREAEKNKTAVESAVDKTKGLGKDIVEEVVDVLPPEPFKVKPTKTGEGQVVDVTEKPAGLLEGQKPKAIGEEPAPVETKPLALTEGEVKLLEGEPAVKPDVAQPDYTEAWLQWQEKWSGVSAEYSKANPEMNKLRVELEKLDSSIAKRKAYLDDIANGKIKNASETAIKTAKQLMEGEKTKADELQSKLDSMHNEFFKVWSKYNPEPKDDPTLVDAGGKYVGEKNFMLTDEELEVISKGRPDSWNKLKAKFFAKFVNKATRESLVKRMDEEIDAMLEKLGLTNTDFFDPKNEDLGRLFISAWSSRYKPLLTKMYGEIGYKVHFDTGNHTKTAFTPPQVFNNFDAKVGIGFLHLMGIFKKVMTSGDPARKFDWNRRFIQDMVMSVEEEVIHAIHFTLTARNRKKNNHTWEESMNNLSKVFSKDQQDVIYELFDGYKYGKYVPRTKEALHLGHHESVRQMVQDKVRGATTESGLGEIIADNHQSMPSYKNMLRLLRLIRTDGVMSTWRIAREARYIERAFIKALTASDPRKLGDIIKEMWQNDGEAAAMDMMRPDVLSEYDGLFGVVNSVVENTTGAFDSFGKKQYRKRNKDVAATEAQLARDSLLAKYAKHYKDTEQMNSKSLDKLLDGFDDLYKTGKLGELNYAVLKNFVYRLAGDAGISDTDRVLMLFAKGVEGQSKGGKIDVFGDPVALEKRLKRMVEEEREKTVKQKASTEEWDVESEAAKSSIIRAEMDDINMRLNEYRDLLEQLKIPEATARFESGVAHITKLLSTFATKIDEKKLQHGDPEELRLNKLLGRGKGTTIETRRQMQEIWKVFTTWLESDHPVTAETDNVQSLDSAINNRMHMFRLRQESEASKQVQDKSGDTGNMVDKKVDPETLDTNDKPYGYFSDEASVRIDGDAPSIYRADIELDTSDGLFLDNPTNQTERVSAIRAVGVGELLTEILKTHGIDGETAGRMVEPVRRIGELIEKFTRFDTFKIVGELGDPRQRQLLGAARIGKAGRAVYLNATKLAGSTKSKANVMMFTAAHEMFHLFDAQGKVGQLPENLQRSYDKFVSEVKEFSVDERRALMRTFVDEYMPKSMSKDKALVDALMQDDNLGDFGEFLANAHAMMGLKMVKGGLPNGLKYMPDSVREFYHDAIETGRDGMTALKNLFAQLWTDKDVHGKVSQAQTLYRKLAKDLAAIERDVEKGSQIVSKLGEGSWVDGFGKEDFGSGELAAMWWKGTGEDRQGLSEFNKAVMPFLGAAHWLPQVKDYVVAIWRESGDQRRIITDANAIYYRDAQGQKYKSPPIERINKNLAWRTGYERIRHVMGETGLNLEKMLADQSDPRHVKVREEFDKLPVEGKRAVAEHIRLEREVTRHVQDQVKSSNKYRTELNLAKVLMHAKIVDKPDAAVTMARGLNENSIGYLTKDANGLDQSAALLQQLQAQYGNAAGALLSVIKAGDESLRLMEDVISKEGSDTYISERRYGKWLVQFLTEDGISGSWSFDSWDAAKAAQKNPNKYVGKDAGYKVKQTFAPWDTHTTRPSNVRADDMQQLLTTISDKRKAIMQEMINMHGLDEASAKSIADQFGGIVLDMRKAVDNDNPMNFSTVRMHKPGREDLDFMYQQREWVRRTAVSVARSQTDAYLKLIDADPNLKTEKGSEMKQYLYDQVNNMRTPDTKAGRMITRMNFLWRLGLNMGSHIIEAVTWPLILAPALMAKGAGFSEAMRLGRKATMPAFRYVLNDLGGAGHSKYERLFSDKAYGKEIDLLISQAEAEGRVHTSSIVDPGDMDVVTDEYRARWLSEHGNENGEVDKIARVGALAFNAVAKVYQPFTRANAHINLIAFYEHSKAQLAKQGYKGPDLLARARTEAMFSADQANTSAGKPGRPTGLFGGKGFLRTLSMSSYSLGSFTTGHFFNQLAYLTNGIKMTDPTQRAAYRKAAATSFSLHFAAAGMFGLPVVGLIAGLARQYFGIDVEQEARDWMSRDMNPTDAGMLNDLAFHGIPYSLGVTPDIGAKLTVGGPLGLNSQTGWAPEGALGAIGGFYKDFKNAVQAGQERGVTSAMGYFLPNAARKVLSLATDGGQLKDMAGNVIYSPSTIESLSNVMGFRPVQFVKEARAAQAALNLRDRAARENQKIAVEFAKRINAGENPAKIKAELKELAGSPDKYKRLLNASVSTATKQLFTRDPNDNATVDTFEAVGRLNAAYGVRSEPPQAGQRAKVKQQIVNRFGMGVSPSSVGNAAQIDALRRQNPFMTTAEARHVLDQRRSPQLE